MRTRQVDSEKGKNMRYTRVILGIFCAAALARAESLLLLPITGEMDATDLKTVNRLYRDVVQAQFPGSLLPSETGPACAERDCALRAAQEARADKVIYSSLNKLGSKWVFSSTLLRADGSGAFNQRLTALSVEDFEAVTQRMGDALLSGKTAEQAVSLDNITEKESTREPERRKSLSASGIALGYMFPAGNDKFSHINTGDDTVRYSQIIRASWLNNWELRDNWMLGAELVWGIGASFGGDLNLNYVFNRTDFSPFLGGGVGLHYVASDDDASDNKRNSGPALNVQGGMLLFRTYDVHVLLRGQYQVIFNSDVDQGFVLDAGFTFGKLHL